MIIKLIITYILNIIDLIATMLLIKRFGATHEVNALGKWLIETNLVYFVKIVVVGMALLAIGLLSKNNQKLSNIASWILLFAYIAVTIYHGVILFHLQLI